MADLWSSGRASEEMFLTAEPSLRPTVITFDTKMDRKKKKKTKQQNIKQHFLVKRLVDREASS